MTPTPETPTAREAVTAEEAAATGGYEIADDWDDGYDRCPYCHGTGTASALSRQPEGAPFIASYGDCASCDGTGRI